MVRSSCSTCVVVIALATLPCWTVSADEVSDAIDLLGGRTGKIVASDINDGRRLYLLDLSDGSLGKVSEDVLIESALISPDGTRVVYSVAGQVYVQPLAGGARELIGPGYDPHWWIDQSGDDWIYLTTQGVDSLRKPSWPDGREIETHRVRLSDGLSEAVLSWKGSAGPSQDGTHIGCDDSSILIWEVGNPTPYVLNDGRHACNASMSPDNRYLLMHLAGPHQSFAIRDRADNIVWQVARPAACSEVTTPEWSTDPDFAVAVGRNWAGRGEVYIVKISTREVVRVLTLAQGLHDWIHPHLWVGSPQVDGGAGEDSGGPGGDGG